MVSYVVSADWGKEAGKRSVYLAEVHARRIGRCMPPRGGWDVPALLELAAGLARSGSVLVGVDVVLGVPDAYWERARCLGGRSVKTFVEWLCVVGATGRGFFEESPDARGWRPERPWFRVPSGRGSLNAFNAHLAGGMLRRVDRETGAKPVFAVSGIPGTVGSGTRAFWIELAPLLSGAREFWVWPFEGGATPRRTDGVAVCETYPRLAYAVALAEALPAAIVPWAKGQAAWRQLGCDCLRRAGWVGQYGVFAFVLAIGIVVDDAIVVAEHVYQERQRGASGTVAAIRGVRRIAVPLTFAVLTSMVAFSPLMFLPGGWGEILLPLAIILIAMLAISLVESLLVMPNHLSHLPGPDWVPSIGIERFLARTQTAVARGLNGFVNGPLDRWLHFATAQPIVVIAAAIGLLVVSVSLLPAGIVGTVFVDDIEGDYVTASLEMPDGTAAERTFEVARLLEDAGRRVIERLERDRPDDMPPLLDGVIVTVGQKARMEGGGMIPLPRLDPMGNVATVEFKLLGAEHRRVSAHTFMSAWRQEVGVLPYARGLSFVSDLLSFGNPVEIALSHPDPERLEEVADSVVGSLHQFSGVFDVRTDHVAGVKEVQLELRPEGRMLGLTVEEVALQVRSAFFGAEAERVQRGREDVKVYVRLPRSERDSLADIERYVVRTADGGEVPLGQVARLREGASPLTVRRKDGRRVVTVTADVDQTVVTGAEATAFIVETVLPGLMQANPGLTYRSGGEAQQQVESLDSLVRSFVLVMFVIYALLAIPLRSYIQPLIIVAVIPFGLIGVIAGHLAIGIALSFTSAMGFVGLSGVVVNDSIVMIDFINEQLRQGAPVRQAIIEGAKRRFRPIMLTSVTTFFGFTPLILERAVHAKFVVPFAASLGFGILITSALLMLLVPALTAVVLGRQIERSDTRGAVPAAA